MQLTPEQIQQISQDAAKAAEIISQLQAAAPAIENTLGLSPADTATVNNVVLSTAASAAKEATKELPAIEQVAADVVKWFKSIGKHKGQSTNTAIQRSVVQVVKQGLTNSTLQGPALEAAVTNAVNAADRA